MSIARFTADDARRKARVRRKILQATTEADIARHAKADDSATDTVDLNHALKKGRLREMAPLDVAAIRAKTGLSQDRFASFEGSRLTLFAAFTGRRIDHEHRARTQALVSHGSWPRGTVARAHAEPYKRNQCAGAGEGHVKGWIDPLRMHR